jgi:hypothetical protein
LGDSFFAALGQAGLLPFWLMAMPGARVGDTAVGSLAALTVFTISSDLAMAWKSGLSAENSLRMEPARGLTR